jgi:hypothetical protein
MYRSRIGCTAAAVAAVALTPSAVALAQTNFDTIGLTQLLALDPTLTGAGVVVAQGEANDSSGTNTYTFEVNPVSVGQPASLFTYIDQNGNVSAAYNSGAGSDHANTVGGYFYGATGSGVAPGVSHVDNYSADYFYGTIISSLQPIDDTVVNQSFVFGETPTTPLTAADQEATDTAYDNYIAEFGTIIVSAIGNAGDFPSPNAPGTAYNGIGVAADPGPSSVGPTIDNGRSKPDITAPGGATSYSTPLVSGAAAILVQAGRRGDGGDTPTLEADAVDPRTIKALLLNGASKTEVAFTRTHTKPLDPADGAGLLNIYNSYLQLTAGRFAASSVNNTASVGGAHLPVTTGPVINSVAGWDFSTLTSSTSSDAYANYLFSPAMGVTGYTVTATLVWERQFNSNPGTPLGINNLDLYLYDTTTNTLIDYSDSTVDNVQDVYDLNLAPGNEYDLEVLKNGGPNVISNSETYAMAFNFAAVQSTWNVSGGGSWATAGNWSGAIPQNAKDTASFLGAATANATITLDGNWTVGNINFNNNNSYTITPGSGGTLTLDNGGASATAYITDSGGNHAIAAPLVLNSNALLTVASGSTLTVSGPISGAGGVTIAGAGIVALGGSVTVSSMTVNSGATLDIAGNTLMINYGSSADPAAVIRADLTRGRNGVNGAPANWDGTGITSSLAAENPGSFAVGYADGGNPADAANTGVPAGEVKVMYTVAGDVNLNGGVDLSDLVVMASDFGKTGEDWAEGDVNYDGDVDLSDLIIIASNFGESLSAVQGADFSASFRSEWQLALAEVGDASVPEPATLGVVLAAASLVGRRRRNFWHHRLRYNG